MKYYRWFRTFIIFCLTIAWSVDVSATPIPLKQAAIRGWPNHLLMGTVTSGDPALNPLFQTSQVEAIFHYDGDGHGDQGKILDPSLKDGNLSYGPTRNTVLQAQALSKPGHNVMPVIIAYTANGSGWIGQVAQDVGLNKLIPDAPNQPTAAEIFKDHYINFIQLCQILEGYASAQNPYPATLIIDPDFLGVIMQAESWSGLTPDTPVDVNVALNAAFAYLKLTDTIPSFPQTLAGYTQSINWLVKHFAKDVPFGWQINTWAGGSAAWVQKTYTNQNDLITTIFQPVTDFINKFGIYSGPYKADFLAFDRYERDDLFIANSPWFYNHRDWDNYMQYVKYVSTHVGGDATATPPVAPGVPAVLWQLPGGNLTTWDHSHDNDPVCTPALKNCPPCNENLYPGCSKAQDPEEFISQLQAANKLASQVAHIGTAPDYFFGDDQMQSKYIEATSSATLDPNFSAEKFQSVGASLKADTSSDWGLDNEHLSSAVNDNNIVGILWGGGSTISAVPIGTNGDDGGWLSNKIQEYYSSTKTVQGNSKAGTSKPLQK